jgi:hypothetical protein
MVLLTRRSRPFGEQESIGLAVNASFPDGSLLPKGTGTTEEQK